MEAEQLKILKMLEKGTITADEAQELLSALDEATAAGSTLTTPNPPNEPAQPSDTLLKAQANLPNFDRFRSYWRIPLTVSLATLGVGGLALWGLSFSAGWVTTTIAIACAWPLVLLATAGVFISLWSKSALWVHIRVREKAGRRVNISIPAPLRLIGRFLKFAQRYGPPSQSERLSDAQELLNEFDHTGQPLIVNVNDEDGDQVQIYIG